jgi:tetratricopeptide (TPR) repeat protein
MERTIQVIALAVKSREIRARHVEDGKIVILRPQATSWDGTETEGETITVAIDKEWKRGNDLYVSGKILNHRLDCERLGTKPLALERFGDWIPEERWRDEVDESVRHLAGNETRPEFEMEQRLPDDPHSEDDSIGRAVDHFNAGRSGRARGILWQCLEHDIACLDAHAHLGNFASEEGDWLRAKRHWEIGVRLGEWSLGENFDGVLSWGLVNNRPFLRCLHGLGLATWRLGQPDEARKIFERMIRLNPSDNQGVRALLAAITAGEEPDWDEEELDADDEELFGPVMEGECYGCDKYSSLNDLSLCDDCAAKMDRDLIRMRDWDYSALAFGVAEDRREALRDFIISKYGPQNELLASEDDRRRHERKN